MWSTITSVHEGPREWTPSITAERNLPNLGASRHKGVAHEIRSGFSLAGGVGLAADGTLSGTSHLTFKFLSPLVLEVGSSHVIEKEGIEI